MKKNFLIFGAAAVIIVVGIFAWLKFAPSNRQAQTSGRLSADGNSVVYNDKTYYRVISDDKTRNTGNKVCAIYGKKCKGYTDLSVNTCLAFHPSAAISKDLNGSKAGFYCNGLPQGGICGREMNTCHICRECNLNMRCDTEIGDLYRETFVECGN